MAKACWYSIKVIKTALPALLLILFVLFLILMLAVYTEAFIQTFVLWLVLPFVALYAYRKIKHYSSRK